MKVAKASAAASLAAALLISQADCAVSLKSTVHGGVAHR